MLTSIPQTLTWGFPKIRVTILGVPIVRIIVFGGPYWGPPILGNHQMHVPIAGWALTLFEELDTSLVRLHRLLHEVGIRHLYKSTPRMSYNDSNDNTNSIIPVRTVVAAILLTKIE